MRGIQCPGGLVELASCLRRVWSEPLSPFPDPTPAGAFYNAAPCLSRPDAPEIPALGGGASRGDSVREASAWLRSSANCALAVRAAASCCRAARHQRRWPNQVTQPPATTPRIATAMISAKSGIETATDGWAELKGSNDTVTKWRFATAKVTKIRPSRMANKVLKNFRMRLARVDWPHHAKQAATGVPPLRAKVSGFGFGIVAVQPLAHFLARLEERNAFLIDRHMGTGARVAAGPRGTMFHGERAETAQLDPVAARQRSHDLIEDRIHDILDIPLIEVRVVLGNALNEFRFDHKELRTRKRRPSFP